MYKRSDSWYSDFWYKGKRYQKSWGPMSKTVAKEKERKYKTEIAEGKHQQKARPIIFETFAEKYLEYARTNKKPSAARRNESSMGVLKPHFRGKLLNEINSFMVEQYKKSRKDQGRAAATINRDIDCIKSMMKMAVEWKYLSVNPISEVKKFKEDNEKMWVLTPDEEYRLLAECDKRNQRRKYLKDLVLFALHTGARLDEILKLKKCNVHRRERYILVTDTKTGDNRPVPINDTLLEVLKRQYKSNDSDYVFCNANGKRLTVLTNSFWNAVEKVGLVRWERRKKIRFRFHDLRHTFGSRLGMGGYDLKTIMEIMGHKTTKVAMRYQHPTPEHKMQAVKFLDQVPEDFTTGKIIPLKHDVKTVG